MSFVEKQNIQIYESCLSNNPKFPIIKVPNVNYKFKTLAMVVVDIDKNFYHGIYFNIPSNTKVIHTIQDYDFLPSNTGDKFASFCPPSGDEEHHYHFDFYFLNNIVPENIKNTFSLLNYLDKNKIQKITKVKKFKCPIGKKCFYK